MKRTVTIGLLGAILAIAVGFISTGAISATPFLMAANQASTNDSEFMMIGHVEYTVRDATGQIKQYAQGDNLIVETGTDCAAQLIFDRSDTSACDFQGTGFNFIAIGNFTGGDVDGTETALDFDAVANTGEVNRTSAVISIDTAASNTVATISTEIPFSFELLPSGTTIWQSGLFDNDGTAVPDNMFSMRDGLDIDVAQADTLSVTWKVTLDNGSP